MKSKKSVYPFCFFLGGIALFLLIFLIFPQIRILRFFHLMSLEIQEGDVTLLFEGLKSPKKKIVKNAMQMAEICIPNEESFALILEHLLDPHPPSRFAAIRLLAKYEEDGEDGVPHLIQHLEDEEEEIFQYNILLTLEQIRPASEVAALKVVPFLTHKKFEIRKKTAEVLIAIGLKAGVALPQLILYEEPFPKNRYIFEKALELVGPASEEVIPDFLEILKEYPEEKIQEKVLKQLGRMGPAGKTSIPDVLLFLKSDSNVLRCLALFVLGELGEKSPHLQQQVLEQLLAKSGDVRKQALLTLQKIGSSEQVPFLEQLLQKELEPTMKLHLQETLEILKRAQ